MELTVIIFIIILIIEYVYTKQQEKKIAKER
jgi:preprotein translocase subunit SecG